MHPPPSLLEAPPSEESRSSAAQQSNTTAAAAVAVAAAAAAAVASNANSVNIDATRNLNGNGGSVAGTNGNVGSGAADSSNNLSAASTSPTLSPPGGVTPVTPSQSHSPPMRRDSKSMPGQGSPGPGNVSMEAINTSRRTGPLSQQQREKAALIRKLGACNDCRRRRVACHPSHHNMTWEDAVRKYHRSNSPTVMADIAPLGSVVGRPISPAPSHTPSNATHSITNHTKAPMMKQDTQEMDIDSIPSRPPLRPHISDNRIRTPLPSGPRTEKPTSLPGIESFKTDMQGNSVAKMLTTHNFGRYTTAHVLLLYWQEDDYRVQASIQDLAEVLGKLYGYMCSVQAIPLYSDGCKSSFRWLSKQIHDFAEDDHRDVLKLVYYCGNSYLDSNREMMITRDRDSPAIRWNAIQPILEEARSETLIIMDAPYYASSAISREKGMLEIIAAASCEEHFRCIKRCFFTRAVSEELRARIARGPANAFSAAELHAKLLSVYPTIMLDVPERSRMTSLPTPVHIQASGSTKLPSILLKPLRQPPPFSQDMGGQQMQMTFRITDEPVDVEAWLEWLRLMPDSVRHVKTDGPWRAR